MDNFKIGDTVITKLNEHKALIVGVDTDGHPIVVFLDKEVGVTLSIRDEGGLHSVRADDLDPYEFTSADMGDTILSREERQEQLNINTKENN